MKYVMTSPEVPAYFSPNLHVSVLHHSPSLVYSDECEDTGVARKISGTDFPTCAQMYWDLKEQFPHKNQTSHLSFSLSVWLILMLVAEFWRCLVS